MSIFTKRATTVFPGLEPLQPWQDAFRDPLVDPLLILNLRLHILNRITGLHIQRDRLARQCLDKDLHPLILNWCGPGFRPTATRSRKGLCRAHADPLAPTQNSS